MKLEKIRKSRKKIRKGRNKKEKRKNKEEGRREEEESSKKERKREDRHTNIIYYSVHFSFSFLNKNNTFYMVFLVHGLEMNQCMLVL